MPDDVVDRVCCHGALRNWFRRSDNRWLFKCTSDGALARGQHVVGIVLPPIVGGKDLDLVKAAISVGVHRERVGIHQGSVPSTEEQFMDTATKIEGRAAPWNKGKLLGQKPPLKLKEIWAIRVRLQLARQARELALFNLAIDSKLRGCDLVAPSFNPAVFPDRRVVGRVNWTGPGGLRDALSAPHQGHPSLPPDQKSPGRSSSCLGTRNLKAPSGILGSRSTML